jgi:hypothetical protein
MQERRNDCSHRQANRATARQLPGLKNAKGFRRFQGDRSASQIILRSPAVRRCGVSHVRLHQAEASTGWLASLPGVAVHRDSAQAIPSTNV